MKPLWSYEQLQESTPYLYLAFCRILIFPDWVWGESPSIIIEDWHPASSESRNEKLLQLLQWMETPTPPQKLRAHLDGAPACAPRENMAVSCCCCRRYKGLFMLEENPFSASRVASSSICSLPPSFSPPYPFFPLPSPHPLPPLALTLFPHPLSPVFPYPNQPHFLCSLPPSISPSHFLHTSCSPPLSFSHPSNPPPPPFPASHSSSSSLPTSLPPLLFSHPLPLHCRDLFVGGCCFLNRRRRSPLVLWGGGGGAGGVKGGLHNVTPLKRHLQEGEGSRKKAEVGSGLKSASQFLQVMGGAREAMAAPRVLWVEEWTASGAPWTCLASSSCFSTLCDLWPSRRAPITFN